MASSATCDQTRWCNDCSFRLLRLVMIRLVLVNDPACFVNLPPGNQFMLLGECIGLIRTTVFELPQSWMNLCESFSPNQRTDPTALFWPGADLLNLLLFGSAGQYLWTIVLQLSETIVCHWAANLTRSLAPWVFVSLNCSMSALTCPLSTCLITFTFHAYYLSLEAMRLQSVCFNICKCDTTV